MNWVFLILGSLCLFGMIYGTAQTISESEYELQQWKDELDEYRKGSE